MHRSSSRALVAAALRLTSLPCRRLHSFGGGIRFGCATTSTGRSATSRLLDSAAPDPKRPPHTYKSKRLQERMREEEERLTRRSFATNEEFLAQVDKLYARLESGLSDMLSLNASMRFLPDSSSGHTLEVDLGESRGSFTFTLDESSQRLVLFSPISASAYRYRYDVANAQWVADADSHILDELFVREVLTSDLKGYPHL